MFEYNKDLLYFSYQNIKSLMQFFTRLFSKIYTTTLTVTSSNGFHLRPVAQFVTKAKVFDAEIDASFNNKTVNAKAVNTLLSLNLDKGDSFILSSRGQDAEIALKELKNIFTLLMRDDKEIAVIAKKAHHYEGAVLEGLSISTGIAIAPLHRYTQIETHISNTVDFTQAITMSLEELDTLYTEHKVTDDASIFLAQKELLITIADKSHTLEMLETHIKEETSALKGGKLESKISDYHDLLNRVKIHLGYTYTTVLPDRPFILLAEDLLPSQIQSIEKSAAVGVILQKTSPASHTSILLRSSGITSIIVTETVSDHTHDMILDANAGVLVTSPTTDDTNSAKASQRIEEDQKAQSYDKRFEPSLTTGQRHVHVLANVADVASAISAKEEGAEGIGLLRSEFLFKAEKPSLEVQQTAYTEIFSLFDDITVRTLDVGGDKALPYIQIPDETNPFLGIRGVRLFETHPEILEEQLHAIFLAAQGKKIKIMFPMVSTVEEFSKAKSFAQHVAKKHQINVSNIFFGIMIEVPSVLFLLEDFNKVVDFYSIGTNDLTQYLFAIERTHPILKTDELSPVVFSALKSIMDKAEKPISICGELAANKAAISKLIGLGMETLSVSPKSVAQTKEEIRHV
jgi:multiphosphoryl transfer protein